MVLSFSRSRFLFLSQIFEPLEKFHKESIDTRVPSRIVPQNGSKQVQQRGLVLLIGAEHRLPLPPCPLPSAFTNISFTQSVLVRFLRK